MALSAKSLILYGIEVTMQNQNIDFVSVISGPQNTATIPLGFYSLAGLADAIATAMINADPVNNYTVSVDRTVMGNTQNRVTISTTGTYLDLLFATGTNVSTSAASLIGFNATDYTGSTSYTGSATVGTALIPNYIGFNYQDPTNQAKLFGAVNVAASGLKESVVFNIQKFIDVAFKYEVASRLPLWKAFFYWAIQQREFDFTPEITNPTVFYRVTLEKTQYDGKGLGFQMKEMLPNLPNAYETGNLNLRVIESQISFL